MSTKDIPTLRAMHRATHLRESLWSDIANTLELFQNDDFEKVVTLRVWKEF